MLENMAKSMFCRQSHPCGDVRQTDRQTLSDRQADSVRQTGTQCQTDMQTVSDRQADCIIDCLVMITFGRSRMHLAPTVN